MRYYFNDGDVGLHSRVFDNKEGAIKYAKQVGAGNCFIKLDSCIRCIWSKP